MQSRLSHTSSTGRLIADKSGRAMRRPLATRQAEENRLREPNHGIQPCMRTPRRKTAGITSSSSLAAGNQSASRIRSGSRPKNWGFTIPVSDAGERYYNVDVHILNIDTLALINSEEKIKRPRWIPELAWKRGNRFWLVTYSDGHLSDI